MLKQFLLLVTFNLFIDCIKSTPDSEVQAKYYWRDFELENDIPKDALPGGINSLGKTTYIGQVLHGHQLIPAKIDSEPKKITYEWGHNEYTAYINIKILCTKHPKLFDWVETSNRHINTIDDKQFIVAGYEPNVTLLIGRTQLQDELAVGKVVFTNDQSTLNTTKDGKSIQHDVFEVLAYNPEKTAVKNINDTEPHPDSRRNRTIIINFFS